MTNILGAALNGSYAVTIHGTNDTPVAPSVSVSLQEDTLLLSSGIIAATDPDNTRDGIVSDLLSFTPQTTAGLYGTLTLNANGAYTYTLNNSLSVVQALGQDESLSETFNYTVKDQHGGITVGTLTVNISGTNDLPVPTVQTASLTEDVKAVALGSLRPVPDPDVNDVTVTYESKAKLWPYKEGYTPLEGGWTDGYRHDAITVGTHKIKLTANGEDTIVTCPECGWRANMEAAESIIENKKDAEDAPLTPVHTPGQQTIEDVCTFLKLPVEQSCKAVVYQKNATDEYIILFLRGDLEANETKLTNFLGEAIHPATITPESGIAAGYIGPLGLPKGVTVLFDSSLKGTNNLCCGANREEYHYTGFCFERDCSGAAFHDFAKVKEGGICPKCGKHTLSISRGIEVGNIFQLGTKYTKTMGMQYLDQNGQLQYPIMGCYGIGVGRLAASVCEAHHDAYGPIWPMSIAPWQVHLCCMRADNAEVRAYADSLYEALQARGLEVIYDDRSVSAGVMFSDADLLGVPVRVVASPRNLKEGCIELSTRDKKVSEKVPVTEAVERIAALRDELLAACRAE